MGLAVVGLDKVVETGEGVPVVQEEVFLTLVVTTALHTALH